MRSFKAKVNEKKLTCGYSGSMIWSWIHLQWYVCNHCPSSSCSSPPASLPPASWAGLVVVGPVSLTDLTTFFLPGPCTAWRSPSWWRIQSPKPLNIWDSEEIEKLIQVTYLDRTTLYSQVPMKSNSISTRLPTFRDLADASHSSFDRARRGGGSDAAGIFA